MVRSIAKRERLNSPDTNPGSRMRTQLPDSSDLHNPGSQSYLIELFPMAAYAVRAPDGVIAWFNSRAAELWGRVPAVGDTDERFCGAYRLYHADGTPMAHCDTPVALALKTGISVHEQEVVIERPEGSRVTVSVHIDPIRDQNGAIVGVVNFFHDISERKRAEDAQRRLAAIVESSDDGIVSKDLNGTITSWNAGAQQIFGFTPEEAIGQPITLIIPPELHPEEKQIVSRLRNGERIDHYETIRVKKDGSKLHVSLTISPLRNSEGRVVGASKIVRDITERKRIQEAIMESELSARLLQLQDAERRRIARELHDGVGQLIIAIGMNASKVAGEKAKLSPEAARCAEDNVNLAEQIATDIRTVSYLLHPPLLDEMGLRSALQWYLDGFAERSKIAAKLEVPEHSDRLPPDYELCLFRVAQECLTNIHRHSGSSTALVKLWRTPEELRMEVSDEGRGIHPEIQSKFASGESAGVGLRGMQERVKQIGGTLRIHSNGKGASVLVTLPLTEDAVPPGATRTATKTSMGEAKPCDVEL
jgi:PAS domain S-box-containing protein